MAFIIACPFELTVLQQLWQCPAVKVVNIYIQYIERRLGRIVKLAYQLVFRTGVLNNYVTNAVANVRLNNAIYFRIGDYTDLAIDLFEQRASRKLRRVYVIHRIVLVLVDWVSPKAMEHIGNKGDVARKIKQHVRVHIFNLKVSPHSLGAGIICVRALITGQSTEELSSKWKLNLSKSLDLVDLVTPEHFFLLD